MLLNYSESTQFAHWVLSRLNIGLSLVALFLYYFINTQGATPIIWHYNKVGLRTRIMQLASFIDLSVMINKFKLQPKMISGHLRNSFSAIIFADIKTTHKPRPPLLSQI